MLKSSIYELFGTFFPDFFAMTDYTDEASINDVSINNMNEELSSELISDGIQDTGLDFLTLPRDRQIRALEVLLFASEEPLSAQTIYDILIFGEEREKKSASKTAKNGASQINQVSGHLSGSNGAYTNGTHKNGASENGVPNEAQNDAINEKEPTKIAYLRTEPLEGMTASALENIHNLRLQHDFLPHDSDNDNKSTPEPSNEAASKQDNSVQLIHDLIEELNAELEATKRVFRVIELAREGGKGYQFATNPEHGEILARLVKSKSKKRLSKAGLETLAIIAYRQPVSKPELEVIRGVSSNEIMNRLLEKNLITIVGRSESVGKPLLYGTTDEFLHLFGLNSLADLPKPRELEELMEERADILEIASNLTSEAAISTPPEKKTETENVTFENEQEA